MFRFNNRKKFFEAAINVIKDDVSSSEYIRSTNELRDKTSNVIHQFVNTNLANVFETAFELSKEEVDNSTLFDIVDGNIFVNISAYIRIFDVIIRNFRDNTNILSIRNFNTQEIGRYINNFIVLLSGSTLIKLIKIKAQEENITTDEQLNEIIGNSLNEYIDVMVSYLNKQTGVRSEHRNNKLYIELIGSTRNDTMTSRGRSFSYLDVFDSKNRTSGKEQGVFFKIDDDHISFKKEVTEDILSVITVGDRNTVRQSLGDVTTALEKSNVSISIEIGKSQSEMRLGIEFDMRQIMDLSYNILKNILSEQIGSLRYSGVSEEDVDVTDSESPFSSVDFSGLDYNDIEQEIKDVKKNKFNFKNKSLNKLRKKFNLDTAKGKVNYLKALDRIKDIKDIKKKRAKLQDLGLDYDEIENNNDLSNLSDFEGGRYSGLDYDDGKEISSKELNIKNFTNLDIDEKETPTIGVKFIAFCKNIQNKKKISNETREEFSLLYKNENVEEYLAGVIGDVNDKLIKQHLHVLTPKTVFYNMEYLADKGEAVTANIKDFDKSLKEIKKNKTVVLIAKTIVKLFADDIDFKSDTDIQMAFDMVINNYIKMFNDNETMKQDKLSLKKTFGIDEEKEEKLDKIIDIINDNEEFYNSRKNVDVNDELYNFMYKDLGFVSVIGELKNAYDSIYDLFNNRSYFDVVNNLTKSTKDFQRINDVVFKIRGLYNACFKYESDVVKKYAALCLRNLLKTSLSDQGGKKSFSSFDPITKKQKAQVAKYVDGGLAIRVIAMAPIEMKGVKNEEQEEEFKNMLFRLGNEIEIVNNDGLLEIRKVIALDNLIRSEIVISKDCVACVSTCNSADVSDFSKEEDPSLKKVDLNSEINVDAVLDYWRENTEENSEDDDELTYAEIRDLAKKRKEDNERQQRERQKQQELDREQQRARRRFDLDFD